MGFGAMQLGGRNAFGPPVDRATSQQALRTALELGVRHVDTSDYYGPYLVNELIKETLAPYPDDLVLVTKIGGRRATAGQWLPALDPRDICAFGVRGRPRAHSASTAWTWSTCGSWTPDETDRGDKFESAGRAARAGTDPAPRGSAMWDATQLDRGPGGRAGGVRPEHATALGNRARRRAGGQLRRAQGIAYVAVLPAGRRVLPFFTDGLEAVAKRHQVSTHQVGLAWLLRRSPNMLVIPGSGDPAHVEDNVAAAGLTLTEADLAELSSSGS